MRRLDRSAMPHRFLQENQNFADLRAVSIRALPDVTWKQRGNRSGKQSSALTDGIRRGDDRLVAPTDHDQQPH